MIHETELGHSISRAVEFLHSGALVAIPTETVYGLAANALDEVAVLRIFEAKNRPAFDPLIVHVADTDSMSRYALLPDKDLQIIETLSPGPATYILKRKAIIPDIVTSGLDTVGMRIPQHPGTLELLRELDFPLAAPSANPFGYVSPTTAQHVYAQLKGCVSYILDGGPCSIGIESTIIDLSGVAPQILRLGGYSIEALEALLHIKINKIKLSSSRPNAPGMLMSHYAPKVRLYARDIESLTAEFPEKKWGALRFSALHPALPANRQKVLSSTGNLTEAAARLFAVLREWDSEDVDGVSVEFAPDHGLGRAINDRLRRATHHSEVD